MKLRQYSPRHRALTPSSSWTTVLSRVCLRAGVRVPPFLSLKRTRARETPVYEGTEWFAAQSPSFRRAYCTALLDVIHNRTTEEKELPHVALAPSLIRPSSSWTLATHGI